VQRSQGPLFPVVKVYFVITYQIEIYCDQMKKRILYIQPNAGVGGSFQSLYVLLENLDRSKYTPTVLLPLKNQVLIDKLSEINVSTVIYPFPSMGNSFNLKYKIIIGQFLENMFKKRPLKGFIWLYPAFLHIIYSMFIVFDFLRFYIKKQSVIKKNHRLSADLVHINSLVGLFGYYYAKKHGYPVVWHIREQLPEISRRLLKIFYSGIFKDPCIKHLICISENEARPFTHGKIRVVHNFYKLQQQSFPTGRQVFYRIQNTTKLMRNVFKLLLKGEFLILWNEFVRKFSRNKGWGY